jgi:ketosteroid isomerase-like protein
MTAVETQVLEVFDALFVALTERHDALAATRLFVDEPDVVMWGSEEPERAVGRAAIGALHAGIAAHSGTLVFRWYRRHVHVEHEAAWVNADGEVVVTGDGQPLRVVPYRLTAIFVRREDEWGWHTFHGSEPNLS